MVINSDQPVWLTGMLEMTRTLGLELMENALAQYAHVFRRVSIQCRCLPTLCL
jgi:hypothetical protein